MKEHCIYKYTQLSSGDVLYIGKTDASLKQRIDAHAKEPSFEPYLGDYKVEYFTLANSTETDIVEKYLINLWKPPLNKKDNVGGLSVTGLLIPTWHPYEEYEAKHYKDIPGYVKKLKQTSIMTEELIDAAYDALLEGESSFVTNTLASGVVFSYDDSRMLPLVEKETQATESGYSHILSQEAKVHLESNIWKIRRANWLPVAKVFPFKDQDKEIFNQYEEAYLFAKKLEWFKVNGFYEDELSEMCVLTIGKSEAIRSFYSEMILESYGSLAEIDCEGYDKIPRILENIAQKECQFFKSRGIWDEKEIEYFEFER